MKEQNDNVKERLQIEENILQMIAKWALYRPISKCIQICKANVVLVITHAVGCDE